jgi:hypothetical protein
VNHELGTGCFVHKIIMSAVKSIKRIEFNNSMSFLPSTQHLFNSHYMCRPQTKTHKV